MYLYANKGTMVFKDHKVNIQQVLSLIPEGLISKLAIDTKVDYCAKCLQGERIFNLLLFAILKTDRLSQRFLEDVFSHIHFKFLFNYSIDLKVTHSSISERLSKINLDFFSEAYTCIYKEYDRLYNKEEQKKLRLIRVDSSMVAETGKRLFKGMLVGKKMQREKKGKEKKQLKYSMAYNGSAVEKALIYSDPEFLSEDRALSPLIEQMIKSDDEHRNLYLFDRGLCALESFEMINKEEAFFLCRIKTNRKIEVVKSLIKEGDSKDLGTLELVSDELVQLYDNKKKEFSPTLYRRVIGKRKSMIDTTPIDKKGKQKRMENEIHFLTNCMDIPPAEVASLYKKRWDIEVFFRFIKQELNFKHFLSLSENGLQVVLYMTLIAAMLLMIYKKQNEIGFTTAKRRFMMELESVIIAWAIILAGGDINKYGMINHAKFIPK